MRNKRVIRITYMSMLLTLIVVLSVFESTLPPLPLMPPGVKPGLANIVTMFTLFFMGKREAFALTVLKAGFVMLTRGVTAGLLSLSGGVLSVAALIVLSALFKERISYMLLSISGAITHNMGQLAAVSIILGTGSVIYYLPVLIISGVVMGSVTGVLFKTLLPVLKYPLGGGDNR